MAYVKEIKASSRVSCKIKDNFYTVEFEETVVLEDGDNDQQERDALWGRVNAEVDNQIADIVEAMK